MTAYDQVQEEMEAPPSLKARRRSVVDPTKVDRLPPFSEEAEQGILGCIIMTTGECLNEAMNGVKAPDAFFDLRHRVLWQTMIWMSDAEIPIDIITLNQCLKDRHQLEGAGGLAYLASLPDTVPSAANLSYYIEILNEKYDRRKLIQVCTETVAKIYEDEGSPIDPLVDRISSAANLIRSQIEKPMTMKEAARQVVELIEEAGKGKVPGLKTGLYKLDDVIGGLRDGELITVAARPGCGKSSLATTLVENIAIRNQRVHTVIFSLEMSRMEICTRLMSSLSNINLQSKIRGYQTLEGEHNDITAAQIQLGKAPIHIVATPRISISQLKAQAKMLVETEGTKFIIVDYLQIVQATNPRDMRSQQVAEIARGLKEMAFSLNVPVLALAQLNRESDKEDRKPRLSDLKESGAIEEASNVVLLMHPAQDSKEDNGVLPVNLFVAKSRDGATRNITLGFRKTVTRFENYHEQML